jgi:outer membrane protein
MNCIKYLSILGLLTMGTLYAQGDVSSFSLDEAVQYGLSRSPQMRLAQAEIAASEAQIMEYRSIGIPKVNASGAYSYYFAIPTQILPDFLSPAVDGRLLTYDLIEPGQVIPPSEGGVAAQFGTRNILNLGIEASFMVFDPAFFAGLKAIKNARSLAMRQKESQVFTLKANIIKAYLTLAYNYEVKKSLANDLATARKSLQEAKSFFENGFLEELDINRLEYTVSMLETEAEKMEQFIQLSENLLKFQINYPLEQPISITNSWQDLSGRFAAESLESQLNMAPNRPEVKVIETTQTLLSLQIASTKAGYYPTLRGFAALNGQLLRNDLFNGSENPWFPASLAGLNLSIPIFDGNLRKAQIRSQRIEWEKAGIQKEQLETAIRLEVDNARINLNNAIKTFMNQEKNKALAEKIYRTAQVKFREGVGSSLELTQAESDVLRAQTSLLDANFNVVNARFELLRALGKI